MPPLQFPSTESQVAIGHIASSSSSKPVRKHHWSIIVVERVRNMRHREVGGVTVDPRGETPQKSKQDARSASINRVKRFQLTLPINSSNPNQSNLFKQAHCQHKQSSSRTLKQAPKKTARGSIKKSTTFLTAHQKNPSEEKKWAPGHTQKQIPKLK